MSCSKPAKSRTSKITRRRSSASGSSNQACAGPWPAPTPSSRCAATRPAASGKPSACGPVLVQARADQARRGGEADLLQMAQQRMHRRRPRPRVTDHGPPHRPGGARLTGRRRPAQSDHRARSYSIVDPARPVLIQQPRTEAAGQSRPDGSRSDQMHYEFILVSTMKPMTAMPNFCSFFIDGPPDGPPLSA